MNLTRISFFIIISLFFSFSEKTFAATTPASIPSSAEPEQIQRAVTQNIESKQQQQVPTGYPTPEEIQPSSQAPSTAKKIKFKLKKITLSGNHVYSTKTLETLYEKYIEKEITVAELYDIVQSITNYYRNNAYILTRAILPPQKVENGVVKIEIIEGYINQVNILGDAAGAKTMMLRFGNEITASRPTNLSVLGRNLLLENEIPGVHAKAALEPGKTPGTSELNLKTEFKQFNGFISYDNYGTRYAGPQEVTANLGVNSYVVSGDTFQITYASTPIPEQLTYYGFSYDAPLDSKGTRGTVAANFSKTIPGFTLASLEINGFTETLLAQIKYPYYLRCGESLTFLGAFNYINSNTTSFNEPLYTDHLRTLSASGTYNVADHWFGANLIDLGMTQGMPWMNATGGANATDISRTDGKGVFTKINVDASRVQKLPDHFSFYITVQGQYAFNSLLSAEQFSFGGPTLGRGYDPAEITGDRGMAESAELRIDVAPKKKYFESMQLYLFYDAGQTWNLLNLPGQSQNQSATSTGLGSRFSFSSHLSGNLMVAWPLTKQIASAELIEQGWQPQAFFSLVAFL